MKHLLIILVVVAFMLAGLLRGAEPQAAVAEPKLTCIVDLADGSRIVGVPAVTELKLTTAFGKLNLPLKWVAKVGLRADQETADVALTNGDKISGVIALATLDLQAAWGKVSIPLSQVRTLTVRSIGSSWSARADFTTDANPNGPWSYGWAREDGADFALFREVAHNNTGIDAWQLFEGLGVCIYRGSQTVCGIRPGELSFHPGPNGEHSIVRWQAPKSCTISVKGMFGAGDGGIVNVCVRHNATILFQATDTRKDEPFSLELKVKKDDIVDFDICAGGNGWGGCSTPLEAEIVVK